MRSPLTAMEPYPPPRVDADQTIDGPDDGHSFSSPVSFDDRLRSGPCHCGQSPTGVDCPFVTTPIPTTIPIANRRRAGFMAAPWIRVKFTGVGLNSDSTWSYGDGLPHSCRERAGRTERNAVLPVRPA